ncbi:MAG: spondin domain-containing protein [Thiobacillus sp.]
MTTLFSPRLSLLAASLTLLAGAATTSTPALADDGARAFEVTITNLTRGQRFTPILVASHRAGVKLFEFGQPASAELVALAENGATDPFKATLGNNRHVLDVTDTGGLLDPGQSVTVRVKTNGRFDHLSVASMLIPTNDAFFALNGVAGPNGGYTRTLYSGAYDAGSERNDESCASIPGPFFAECGGPGGGGAPDGDEEGFVHVHAGIHGIGDLTAAERDWRNPVARIVIRQVR